MNSLLTRQITVDKPKSLHYFATDKSKEQLSGFCHILANFSHQAKRVSGSTSRAETLAGVLGREMAQLVNMRLSEMLGDGIQFALQQRCPIQLLIEAQEQPAFCIPVGHCIACKDFELEVGYFFSDSGSDTDHNSR